MALETQHIGRKIADRNSRNHERHDNTVSLNQHMSAQAFVTSESRGEKKMARKMASKIAHFSCAPTASSFNLNTGLRTKSAHVSHPLPKFPSATD